MTLDETTIAAYLGGELDEQARARIEVELDRRPEWLEVVAVMARERDAATRASDSDGSLDPELESGRLSLAPGARVGRFEILGRIASGGMGVVHEAWDPTLERTVALKIAHRVPGDERARERQLREARTLAQLSAPNVVSVFDAGEHEGRIYVAMELLAGPSLRVHLRMPEAPRSARAIVGLFIEAARGLHAAHDKGIVHRDVKPDNMIVEGERVVVVDFGLALPGVEPSTLERLSTIAGTPTQTDTIAGTLAYMAPEQRRGESITARSDQYSLCVALSEALDDAEVRPSARLRAVIERGRAPAPAQRHADLAELISALERAMAAPRRVLLGLGLTALVGAALAVGVGVSWAARRPELPAPAPDPCAEIQGELATTWNDEVRAGLEQQLRSFGKPYLDTLAPRLADALEQRAQAWTRASHAVCSAHARGLLLDEVHAAQRDCLARRRDELEVFVALDWSVGDELSAATSLTALAALQPAHDCEALVGPQEPVLAQGQAREQVAELRRGLAEVEVLRRAARVDAAEVRARALIEQASGLGHEPLLAELRAELGVTLVSAGEHDAGAAELEAALLLAERSGHDWLVARLWIEKLGARGYLQADPEAGREAEAHARAWLRRLGDPVELGLELHRQRGWFELERGDLPTAIEAFEDALALAREPLERATIESGLGAALLRVGELDAAERRLRGALETSARLLGEAHPSVAKTRNNLAGLLRARGELDEARRLFEHNRESFAAAYGADHELVARTRLNIAVVELARGSYAEALTQAEAAAEVLEARLGVEHPHSLMARGTQGSALIRLDRIDEGVAQLREVLAVQLRTLGSDHPSIASSHHDIAAGLADAGRHAEAIVEYERALELRERHGGEDHYELAIILVNLGHAHESIGRPRRAEASYRRALELATPGIEAEAHSRLGRLLIDQGELEAGRAQLEQALKLYRERADEGEKVFAAQTCYALARALWREGGDDQARARELAREARTLYAEGGDELSAAEVRAWLAARGTQIQSL